MPDCPVLSSSLHENTLIKNYFVTGYTYEEIRSFLHSRLGITLTIDQLRRKLKNLCLKRRGSDLELPLKDVEAAIVVKPTTIISAW